jgi:hypothetical protein
MSKVKDFLSAMKESEPPHKANPWDQAHREACDEEKDFYLDPKSGYVVFTEKYHLKRGSCCKSGCRHCPFGFRSYSKA